MLSGPGRRYLSNQAGTGLLRAAGPGGWGLPLTSAAAGAGLQYLPDEPELPGPRSNLMTQRGY
jgi:hypothetical protein